MKKRTISFSPPDISEAEIAEVVRTMSSGWITTGPKVKLFERRLAAYIESGRTDIDCDTVENKATYSGHAVCLSSATAAEELNLRLLGIREGDEVIVPAYTYTATAAAALHCGAKVVFADIMKDGDSLTHSPEMDYDKLEAAVTAKTKAIIPVDIGGIVCNYDKIFDIVERKRYLFKAVEADGSPLGDLNHRIQTAIDRVAVVADCAHSLGASRVVGGQRKNCGNIADFSSFSFHAVKNLTTAEGGAAVWRKLDGVDNSEIYRFYQLLSLHGQNKDALAKTHISEWEYDIIGAWYKCNMTDIMAAIGLKQLDRYNDMLARRSVIVAEYDKICNELGLYRLAHNTEGVKSSMHLYMIRVPNITEKQRNKLIAKLAEAGVTTNVHYKPLPLMTAYGSNCKDFPNSYDYYRNQITLPLYTRLTDEDVAYVCDTLRNVFTGGRRC